MRNRVLLLGTMAFVISGYTLVTPAYDDWPWVSGPYLGQQPPGMTAEMFAPDVVSTDQSEVNSVFSPDGEEFYFTTWVQESGTKILVTRQIEATRKIHTAHAQAGLDTAADKNRAQGGGDLPPGLPPAFPPHEKGLLAGYPAGHERGVGRRLEPI